MIHPKPTSDWPESWKLSYSYDLLEVFGGVEDPGYSAVYRDRQHRTLRAIERFLPPGSSVIDIAAAQGNFSLTLAERGYRVTWNDLREELSAYVRAKWETGDIAFRPGNVFDLDVSEEFDGVLISEVIEHVAHPDRFLERVAGLVKPGGYVFMTTPNGEYFRNGLPRFSECTDPNRYEALQFRPNSDGHIFLLHSDEVQSLCDSSGLQLVDCSVFSTFTRRKLSFFSPLNDAVELAGACLPSKVKRSVMTQLIGVFRRPDLPAASAA